MIWKSSKSAAPAVAAAPVYDPTAPENDTLLGTSDTRSASRPEAPVSAQVQRPQLVTPIGGAAPGAPPRAAGSPAGESHAANQNGGPGGPGNGGPGGPGKSGPFSHQPPEGHAKKMSEVLGEVVWLMSQSPQHKQFFISDLEWFVMTPVLLQQFRLYYASDRPLGVVLWGTVSDEVEQRLVSGASKLRPQDWKSGEKVWAVEVIAPFGGAEDMIKDLKEKVFPTQPVNFVVVNKDGKQVRVV